MPRNTAIAHSGYKSTNAQIKARVFQVYKMLCRGDSRFTIAQYCASEWGTKSRQADEYIKKARALMNDDFAMDRETFAIEILAGLRDLRRRAIADKQYAVALGCISRMAAITNVDGNGNKERP